MINKIIKFITSMQFMTLLILLFAFAIGYATFIENDFGRSNEIFPNQTLYQTQPF